MDVLVKLFVQILNMGITASYVILAVLLIRTCIKKAPKIYSYVLWLAVGFRLICPVSFSSVLSIFNFNLFNKKYPLNDTVVINTYIPANTFVIQPSNIKAGTEAVTLIPKGSLPVLASGGVSLLQIVTDIAAVLWVIGIAAFLIYSMISYLRLMRRVAKAVHWKENIYECDTITTPFVMGIWKPRIYIPFRLSEKEQNYILKHEMYHIRRKDYLVKPFSFLLLVLYWVNPLIWIAYISMSKDMEMSCDEKVVSELGFDVKADYSMSLLSFASHRSFPAGSPLAFGETNTKSRVKNVLHFKKPRWWISMIIAMICIVVLIACTANPKNKSEAETSNQITGAGTENTITDDTVTDYAKQLYELRNPYIGDAPADGALLKELGIQEKFGDYTLELETSKTPYILRIMFTDLVTDRDAFDVKMTGCATILLALIDNADEIQWSYPYMVDGQKDQITVYWNEQNTRAMNIEDIKAYSESAEKVQELLNLLGEAKFDSNITSSDNSQNSESSSSNTGEGPSALPLQINDFLKKNVTMATYLAYQLPDGYENGYYTATLGEGGNLFLY